MPRDDWARENVKARIGRLLAKEDEESRPTEVDRIAGRRGILYMIARKTLEFIDHIEERSDAPVAVIPFTPNDDGVPLELVALKQLGFNRRGKSGNFFSVIGDKAYVDAGSLLRVCTRQGVDCTGMANELGIVLPSVSPPPPPFQ